MIEIARAVLPHAKVVYWTTIFGVSAGRPSFESARGVDGTSSLDANSDVFHAFW